MNAWINLNAVGLVLGLGTIGALGEVAARGAVAEEHVAVGRECRRSRSDLTACAVERHMNSPQAAGDPVVLAVINRDVGAELGCRVAFTAHSDHGGHDVRACPLALCSNHCPRLSSRSRHQQAAPG